MNIQVYTIKPIKLEKLKDACGQEIIPIKNRLKLHINQNTVGTDSGWIDGCDRRICWSDKDFDYVKAYEFCISYNRSKEVKVCLNCIYNNKCVIQTTTKKEAMSKLNFETFGCNQFRKVEVEYEK
jgi:hypothetical protein